VGKRRRAGAGDYVRRVDKLDRVYYAERATGRRAPKRQWELERDQVAFERARARAAALAQAEEERGRRPFPPSVEVPGKPEGARPGRVPGTEVFVDEDGVEWDLLAVTGEDETG
jgi:hypothetical protein